jgi:hypothetical protein
MVAGLKGKEYAERCMELGLETLEERRQIYKMTQDAQMTSMFEKARSNNQGARTRQATAHQGLAVQYARTDIRKHSFAVRIVEKWNHLPDTVKMAPNKLLLFNVH